MPDIAVLNEKTLDKQIEIWQNTHLYPLLPILTNTETTPNVIFLRGISGSGKTTVSNALSSLLGSEISAIFSADNYFTIDGKYKFELGKVSEAHNECVDSMEKALKSSNIKYIIMDNTHTRRWHLYNAEKVANKYFAKLHYLDIVIPDKEYLSVCLKRQCHNLSESVLLDQWANWEDNPKSIKIPMFVSDEEILNTNHIGTV